MNWSIFQQMEIRHVKLNFQQKEMQEMQLLEPIQHNSQSCSHVPLHSRELTMSGGSQPLH